MRRTPDPQGQKTSPSKEKFYFMTTQQHKWFFEGEEIALETWVWHVVYKDGSELWQFDVLDDLEGRRFYHQFKEIDQKNVAVFEMVKWETPELRYSIAVSPEMEKIFHFRRRPTLNFGTPQEVHLTFECFGYSLNGTSLYHFIMPDNRIVISTNRNIPLLSQ